METRLLPGPWTLSFCHPTTGENHKIPATVPGNVELDLVAHGLLPDPFQGMGAQAVAPFETVDWVYETVFDGWQLAGDDLSLVFGGIDTLGKVTLNGEVVLQSDNMFLAYQIPVTSKLKPSGNHLQVEIKSATVAARAYPRPMSLFAQPYNVEQLYLRKAGHSFGWDIMPRLVSAGLWKEVSLRREPTTRWGEVTVFTRSLSPHRAEMICDWNFQTPERNLGAFTARLTAICGEEKLEVPIPLRFTSGRHSFSIEKPKIWWPRDWGMAHLYGATLELFHGETLCDTKTFRFGVRTVGLDHSFKRTDGEVGDFSLLVNGRPLFVKGTNWVPADAFHSRDPKWVRRNLELIDDAGCNLIRIWGGGVYEDKAFFDFCDEKGLLVWQDFMIGCALPPQDDGFCRRMEIEATEVVKRQRQHPSLALWAGDNETDMFLTWAGSMKPSQNRITREILPRVLAQHDPTRPYIPSSPWLTDDMAARGALDESPEQHLWGPRDYYKGPYYQGHRARFASEMGYHGCPSVESLKKFLSPHKVWPWQHNDEWLLHASEPSAKESGPYGYRVALMAKQMAEVFGSVPENIEDFVWASQFVQAEAFKFFIESFRLRKGERTGIIWWNMVDGWPQFSDAVVDWYGAKKWAYHVIRTCQKPVCLMMHELDAWGSELVAVNDTFVSVSGKARVRQGGSGEVLWQGAYTLGPDGRATLGKVPGSWGKQECLVLEWEQEGVWAQNHMIRGQPPFDLETVKKWHGEMKKIHGVG